MHSRCMSMSSTPDQASVFSEESTTPTLESNCFIHSSAALTSRRTRGSSNKTAECPTSPCVSDSSELAIAGMMAFPEHKILFKIQLPLRVFQPEMSDFCAQAQLFVMSKTFSRTRMRNFGILFVVPWI